MPNVVGCQWQNALRTDKGAKHDFYLMRKQVFIIASRPHPCILLQSSPIAKGYVYVCCEFVGLRQ
jgi:hypothetical protein